MYVCIQRHTEIIVLEVWLRQQPDGRPRVILEGSDSSSSNNTTATIIIDRLKQAVIDTILPTQPWAERLQSFLGANSIHLFLFFGSDKISLIFQNYIANLTLFGTNSRD